MSIGLVRGKKTNIKSLVNIAERSIEGSVLLC